MQCETSSVEQDLAETSVKKCSLKICFLAFRFVPNRPEILEEFSSLSLLIFALYDLQLGWLKQPDYKSSAAFNPNFLEFKRDKVVF